MKILGKIQIHQVLISILIGIAMGVLVQRCVLQHLCPPRHGDMKKHMLSKLSRKLNLSAEQKTQVEAIFESKKPQMKALRAEVRPKFEALQRESRSEIRNILNPEQKIKFDKISAKMEARFNAKMEALLNDAKKE